MKQTMMTFISIALTVVCIFKSNAQYRIDQRSQQTLPEGSSIDRTFLYNTITLLLSDGTTERGLFCNASKDSVYLLESDTIKAFSRDQIVHLRILGKPNRGAAAVSGFLLGTYGGTLIFSPKEPFGYIKHDDSAIKYLLSAGIGSIVGLVFDLVVSNMESQQYEFEFSSKQEQRSAEWIQFDRLIYGKQVKKILHILFQGASVSTRMGQSSQSNSMYYYYSADYTVTEFNVLRKIQITYSMNDRVDIGGSLVRFLEPSFYRLKYEPYGSMYYMESLNAALYGLDASMHFDEPTNIPRTSFRFGAVVGLASVKFSASIDSSSSGYWYGWPIRSTTVSQIDETRFGASLYASVDFYITDGVSLGLIMDHTFVPSLKFPAQPQWGLEERMLGNTSIGFSLGFHF